jgi:hypothetical protein
MVQSGFIHVQTHPDYPGYVRLIKSEASMDRSQRSDDGGDIRYIVRFNDVDAAQMHIHETLKRHCADIDTARYKVSIADAIATCEAVELKHERVWMDDSLEESVLAEIGQKREQLHARHQWGDRLARLVGAVAIFLLVLRFFGLF